MNDASRKKHEALLKRLEELAPLTVAFSGGVDSSFLLAAAHALLGEDVHAVMAASTLHPRLETEAALAFCRERGIRHALLRDDPLDLPELKANGPLRCYHCKKALFLRLAELARSMGHERLVEGSNASDADDYRPGARALQELAVASPLAEVGLTKGEIRQLAREVYALPQADKPSAACLASRVPYGTPLSEALLGRIEAMECFMGEEGFSILRARHHGEILRLELGPQELRRLLDDQGLRERLVERGRGLGWSWVTADLDGYRLGSLNVGVKKD